MWPFLAIITNNSFETIPTAALLSESENVIKKEMKAGETAPLIYPQNTPNAIFQDDQTGRQCVS